MCCMANQSFIQRGEGHWDSPHKFDFIIASVVILGIQHNNKVQHDYWL